MNKTPLKKICIEKNISLSSIGLKMGHGRTFLSDRISKRKTGDVFTPSEKKEIAKIIKVDISEIDFSKQSNVDILMPYSYQQSAENIKKPVNKSNNQLAKVVVELSNKNELLTKTNAHLEAALHEAKHEYDELLRKINNQTLWQRLTRKAVE